MSKRSRPALLKYFQHTGEDDTKARTALSASLAAASGKLVSFQSELCYYVQLSDGASALTNDEETRLKWLLAETYAPQQTATSSFFTADKAGLIMELGPRLTFATAFSSNAVAICEACGLSKVVRMECSRRYIIQTEPPLALAALVDGHAAALHDRMTECWYEKPLESFATGAKAKPVTKIGLLAGGRAELERISEEMGLGFDSDDLDFYTQLFVEKLGRDPTDVECFDMGQSNSEHSRHWFFGGVIEIDGVAKPTSLFQLVKSTLKSEKCNPNSVIAFHDNSSAIQGTQVTSLCAGSPSTPAAYTAVDEVRHPILTAETHNFPSGIAPFPGAETGTGGRIRDVHATGRGAYVVAGCSAYCVGSLCIPGYDLPWEDRSAALPSNLATPLQIQVQASNGASDYGNKFGEPVITGFNRSFGMRLPSGERREWLKPIMFSAGLGQMPACLAAKGEPEPGMWLVKIGGPAYRIGLGGGAASSKAGGEGKSISAADFNAVQRGDAEMENKMNRVIRACAELGSDCPIVSIHDQGAGGNGNVLKELSEPLGAKLQVRSILSGDPSLSVLELWGAEYQENCALLLRPESLPLFRAICARENCPASFVGQVTGDGRVVLEDSSDGSTPVDLPLELVLAKMPRKTFRSCRMPSVTQPLKVPSGTSISDALDRVLRLPSVGSKRFLTNKVDRSVTGLIAQQQCVGPLHIPLANCGVIAHSHADKVGCATAVGEQPIKGLLDTAAMARMSVAEALTNLVWAPITALGDVKVSANWMWAAKLAGEGAAMWDACEAMCTFMCALGVAVDGGKDSLSMAAKVGDETVKAPGALVVTAYASCPDVSKVVTPDLKTDDGQLYLIDISGGRRRLGGTAFAHCYAQLGETPPDIDDADLIGRAFVAVQALVHAGHLLSGHDVSDGGILTALLEMAFAGDRGLTVDLPLPDTATDGAGAALGPLAAAFAEEAGLLVEVSPGMASDRFVAAMAAANVPCTFLGHATATKQVVVTVGGTRTSPVVHASMTELRDVWEATSFELEKLQCNPECVAQEQSGLASRHAPSWRLTYTPEPARPIGRASGGAHPVAVVRQEGSNGDREMAAALHAGGLEPWDVAMADLIGGTVSLDRFRGIVFVGGFSYADVLGSAKGWAAVLKFNPKAWTQLQAFGARQDTFSLGVCNGCQLMALLGWVPRDSTDDSLPALEQPRFVHNKSKRFEARFSSVAILPSPAVLLKDMAGSSLGVWVAHGEGQAHFPHSPILDHAIAHDLAPLRYVNDDNEPTEAYPFNPNGSTHGIAALCSADGRHLAMMPHPERCFQSWQWPWMPKAWDGLPAGPWMQLFHNARKFCDEIAAV
mmetsp:Transcript_29282/g.75454  ORF Transcript_29282/g.75454 Transcript_29282/m.75454 type:complete len:1336 (+) Transcript_29282:104-4111(+)